MPRKGENIYKRKDGRWEGRYIKTHINGKAKYGYVYAKSYRETKEKLNLFRNLLDEGNTSAPYAKISSKSFSLGSIAKKWLEYIQPNIKESSYIKYFNLLKCYIFPYFENTPIDSISKNDIIVFCTEMQERGGKHKSGLSSKTIISIISVLKNVFSYAVNHENISVIDVDSITVKQSKPKQLRILSIQEQQKLHTYLLNDLSLTNLGILLCLYTGIRIGEICALQWNDISFAEKHIQINKTMQRIQCIEKSGKKTSILISPPKSECSIRTIPIPDALFLILKKFSCPVNAYFLTGNVCEFIEPRTLQYRFKTILKSCDIKEAVV